MTRRKQDASETAHRFGGNWTARKLEILRRYFVAYTTALKKQPFKTAYIDAFAGTGYRALRRADEERGLVKAGVETIGTYFVDRLKSIFPGVAPKPKILMNSTNCPLYLFCFAVSNPNPRAWGIALDIANHILKSD
jgi:hypothetical protein